MAGDLCHDTNDSCVMPLRELHEVLDWHLIGYVCEYKGVTVKNMLGRTREKDYIVARVLCAFMFLYKKYTLKSVGKILNRNHASVLHYRKMILNPKDKLISESIEGFRIFLLSKDLRLPTIPQLEERLRINIK